MTPSTSPTLTSSPSRRSIFAQHTRLRRANLEIDLVGLELDERIAGRDDVPFLAQPLGDAGVDDGFSDFGNDDIGWH